MSTGHRAVEYLHQMRRFAAFGQQLEERLEHPALAQPPKPLPYAVPLAKLTWDRPPGEVVHREEMQSFQKFTVIPPLCRPGASGLPGKPPPQAPNPRLSSSSAWSASSKTDLL